MKRVVFVCTGNYYRSRFAELLFNAMAGERGLPWRATSRGTDVYGAGALNVGPLSTEARRGLVARGMRVPRRPRYPAPLREPDLNGADLIVAVCESEHRPHLERDFPAWAARVEYWGVDDLALAPADDALAALERNVRDLVERLADADGRIAR